jgi:hypothetical protein
MYDLMDDLDAQEIIETKEGEYYTLRLGTQIADGVIRIGNGNTVKVTQKGCLLKITGEVEIEIEGPRSVEIGQENTVEVEGGEETPEGGTYPNHIEITGNIKIIATAKITQV